MADLGLGLDGDAWERSDMEDVALLKRVWRNEKCAPVLLPYEEELIRRVRESIQEQEEFLASSKEKGMGSDTITAFMLMLLQLDMDRHNFLIRSYLRTRLHKIQKNYQILLTNEAMYAKMSKYEQKFCRGFTDMLERHFNSCVLSRIPEPLRELTNEGMIPPLASDNHVFVRVLEDLGEDVMIENESVEMAKDNTWLVRFQQIEGLLQGQKLELV